jgi:hypothetical protein
MDRIRPHSFRAPVAIAGAIGLALLLSQAASAGAARRPAAPAPQRPVTASGWVVAIDPTTGQLVMPTPEQMLQLSPPEQVGLLRTADDLPEVRFPDGTVMLDLQGRFMEYSVAQFDASSRPRVGCVDDLASLLLWLTGGAPAPAATLEEK